MQICKDRFISSLHGREILDKYFSSLPGNPEMPDYK